jgi:hypothetical protein
LYIQFYVWDRNNGTTKNLEIRYKCKCKYSNNTFGGFINIDLDLSEEIQEFIRWGEEDAKII